MQKFMNIAKNWDIPEIAETIKIKEDESVYKLICNDNSEFLLKTNNNYGKIQAEEEFLKYLIECKIPVSVPLRTRNNRLHVTYHGNNYVLYKFINGNHIRCETFGEYKEAVQIYGSILGNFHKALNSYTGNTEYVNEMNLYNQIFDWALPIIVNQHKYTKIRDIVVEIKDDMSEAFIDLPKQYIHRDFHEDNIVFEGKNLIGIIDFEIFMIGHKVYDICYILTSILMNNINSVEFKTEWVELIPIFLEKYINEDMLDDYELDSLWYVFLASQLTFIAWAIKHDADKILNDNLQGFYWIYDNKNKINKQIKIVRN